MKIKELASVIFGQRGRRIGLLGLGATTLLTPARVMGGITLAAAGIWTVVNLHSDSSGADRPAGHGRPVAHNVKLTRHMQGRDGIADLSTSGPKLLLAMNRAASHGGKGVGSPPGHLASGASATPSGFLAAGSWSPGFGHHATRAPASHSSSSPGSPNLKESAHVGSGSGAGSAPNGTTDASVHQPGSTGNPVTPPGNLASLGRDSVPKGDPKASHDEPVVVLDDAETPRNIFATPRDDSKLSNDDSGNLGSVPGDPDGQGGLPGDLGGISPEDLGKPSLPDILAPASVPEPSDFPIDLGEIRPEGPGLSLPNSLAPLSVPEPSSTALFGIGLLGLGWARRRFQAVARLGLFTIQLQESPESDGERKDHV